MMGEGSFNIHPVSNSHGGINNRAKWESSPLPGQFVTHTADSTIHKRESQRHIKQELLFQGYISLLAQELSHVAGLRLFSELQDSSASASFNFRVWPGFCLRGGPQRRLCIPWHHASPAEEAAAASSGPARRWCPPPATEGPQAWPPSRPESCQRLSGSRIHGANSREGRHHVCAGVTTRGVLLLPRLPTLPGEFFSGPIDLPRFGEYG